MVLPFHPGRLHVLCIKINYQLLTLQCLEPICSTFIPFLVSADMEVDDSIRDVDRVYINGTYYSPGE